MDKNYAWPGQFLTQPPTFGNFQLNFRAAAPKPPNTPHTDPKSNLHTDTGPRHVFLHPRRGFRAGMMDQTPVPRVLGNFTPARVQNPIKSRGAEVPCVDSPCEETSVRHIRGFSAPLIKYKLNKK